ncbi:ABC transporter permease [Bradyrhizobium sp. Cp5.3]|uniref:ABC transporter permease n=1 Tax=Bradyrhizobium sp. Cp5.3 TaxID=443598 RepID=UPI0018DC5F3A|nr:ABC transporter permease [Bradyrhizobium sp. Cp5.3]
MLLPLAVIVLFSFSDRSYFMFPPSGFSLRWYVLAWEGGQFLLPAIRSIVVGVLTTGIAALLAVGGGLAIRRLKDRPVARVVEFAFLSPLIVPHLILGIALLHFFNPPGLIDTFMGVLLAHVVIVFPFLFRTVLVSIHDLNPQLEEASALLGASSVQTFRHVVLPALMPGLAAGSVLGFIVSFDQFTISMLITQRDEITLPVAIYKYLYDVNDPVVAAVSSVLVAFGFAVTLAIQGMHRMKAPPAA